METLSAFLPFPPSTNNLFNNVGKRRVPTKRYVGWAKEAGMSLLASGALKTPVPGDVAMRLVFYPPDRRKRDIDNLPKAVLDLLVKHGAIEDDSKVRDLHLVMLESDPSSPAGCAVEVWPIACRLLKTRAA